MESAGETTANEAGPRLESEGCPIFGVPVRCFNVGGDPEQDVKKAPMEICATVSIWMELLATRMCVCTRPDLGTPGARQRPGGFLGRGRAEIGSPGAS